MSKYIATATTNNQISEDKWKVANINLSIDDSTLISEIFKWAEKNKAVPNTIRIYQLEEIKTKIN